MNTVSRLVRESQSHQVLWDGYCSLSELTTKEARKDCCVHVYEQLR